MVQNHALMEAGTRCATTNSVTIIQVLKTVASTHAVISAVDHCMVYGLEWFDDGTLVGLEP